jgi:SAM-dependent methyltransferase
MDIATQPSSSSKISYPLPRPEASPPVAAPDWPGGSRRWPGLGDAGYLALRPLARGLVRAVDSYLAPRAPVRVLDIGCGVKPYYPYFAAVASDYVGLDLGPGPAVDVVGRAEELPFDDGSFDAVLATQILEHVEDPPRVIREVRRVLGPGGVAMISTHGTFPYHPAPRDLWRWTQEGLEKIFRDNGDWSDVSLDPAGGTVACFGYIIAWYLKAATNSVGLGQPGRGLIAAVNLASELLDRRVPLHYPRRWTLISNFLVVARTPGRGGHTDAVTAERL